jgi:hypothetical protein
MDDLHDAASRRTSARLPRRILAGTFIGGAIGVVAGLIAGSIAYDGSAVIACALAGALGLGLIGSFVGGMSSLESPQPGSEPSERAEPLAEEDLTSEEALRRPPAGPTGR